MDQERSELQEAWKKASEGPDVAEAMRMLSETQKSVLKMTWISGYVTGHEAGIKFARSIYRGVDHSSPENVMKGRD